MMEWKEGNVGRSSMIVTADITVEMNVGCPSCSSSESQPEASLTYPLKEKNMFLVVI